MTMGNNDIRHGKSKKISIVQYLTYETSRMHSI
jgi:hypothetical protein